MSDVFFSTVKMSMYKSWTFCLPGLVLNQEAEVQTSLRERVLFPLSGIEG